MSNETSLLQNFTHIMGGNDIDNNHLTPYDIKMERIRAMVAKICSIIFAAELVTSIIGNSISLIVLSRKSFQGSSSAVYLRTLAITDMLVLITTLIMVLPQTNEKFCGDKIRCLFLDYISNVLTDLSIWIVVLLTIERLIAIFRPFDTKTLLTPRRSYASLAILLIVLLIADSHDVLLSDRNFCFKCIIIYDIQDPLGEIVNVFASIKASYIPIPFVALSSVIIANHLFRLSQNRKKLTSFTPKKSSGKTLTSFIAERPAKGFGSDDAEGDTKTSLQELDNMGMGSDKNVTKNQSNVKCNKTKTESYENDQLEMRENKNIHKVNQKDTNPQTEADGKGKIPIIITDTNTRTQQLQSEEPTVSRKSKIDQRNQGVFKTLLALNICMIVTKIPHDVVKLYKTGKTDAIYEILTYIVGIILMLNFSINVFLYIGTGTKFRSECRAILAEMKVSLKKCIVIQ